MPPRPSLEFLGIVQKAVILQVLENVDRPRARAWVIHSLSPLPPVAKGALVTLVRPGRQFLHRFDHYRVELSGLVRHRAASYWPFVNSPSPGAMWHAPYRRAGRR